MCCRELVHGRHAAIYCWQNPRATVSPYVLAAAAAAESLDSLLRPEFMEGSNQYHCEYCEAKVSVCGCVGCCGCGGVGVVGGYCCGGGTAARRSVLSRAASAVELAGGLMRQRSPTAAPPGGAAPSPPALLQVDATRTLQLRTLPPLLCFSLQRFVFDFQASLRWRKRGGGWTAAARRPQQGSLPVAEGSLEAPLTLSLPLACT